jgi:hypothetical protein
LATAYFQPTFESVYLANKFVNLVTPTIDTLKVGLIASGTLASRSTSETYATVAELLANNGSALTEVSLVGTNYTRVTLTSVTYSTTALVTTLTAANPAWSSATFSTVYGFVYDFTANSGGDTNGALICIWDFGGAQSVTGTNFTLLLNSSGIVTWSAPV